MRAYTLILLCIGCAAMGGYVAGTIEASRAYRAGWYCSDAEPDGCAEWRRTHEHEMPEGARR